MQLTRNIAGYWLVRYHDRIWNTYTPDIRLAIGYAYAMEKLTLPYQFQ